MAVLVTAILAKDEAQRYLPQVLARCKAFSDKICLLDDRSSDETVEVAKAAGALVRTRSILKDPAWGKEAPARQELWDFASQEAGDGWVLIADADQILHGNPRDLCDTWEFNSWAFVLLDLWDPTHFRTDGYWQAHLSPRPWLFKPSAFGKDFQPQWNKRGIHVGHFPHNAPLTCGIAPPDEYYWLHYSYTTPAQREAKYRQYLTVADQLTPGEKAHAESIMDE